MKEACDSFERLCDLKAAGWLSREEVAELDRHLQSCPACRQQAAAAEDVAGRLVALPAPNAPAIDVTSARAPSSSRPLRWLWAPALAAGLALIFRASLPDSPAPPATADRKSEVGELADAPHTLATYRRAAQLPDADLAKVLEAHDRRIVLYEPATPRLTLLAGRISTQGVPL